MELGCPLQEKQWQDSPSCSKLGGKAICSPSNVPWSKDLLSCACCEKKLWLVAQIYAPVEQLERCLYVFGCNSGACSKNHQSWKVYRSQTAAAKQEDDDLDRSKIDTATSIFNDTNWDSSDSEEDGDNVDASIRNLLLSRELPWTNDVPVENVDDSIYYVECNVNAFPSVKLSFFDEPREIEGVDTHALRLYKKYMEEENEDEVDTASGGASGGKEHGESYERTPVAEKYFGNFKKRLQLNPQQCIRYEYGSEPLWPIQPPAKGIEVPQCTCGQERVFEFQLMPSIIFMLNVDEFAHRTTTVESTNNLPISNGMDWTTVLIYSCPDSCNNKMQREKAIEHFKSKLRDDPFNVHAHHNLAILLKDAADINGYMESCRLAVITGPANATMHNEMGSALFTHKDIPLALEHLREALRINPYYVTAHINISAVYASTGEYALALSHSLAAINHDRHNVIAHRNAAKLFEHLGRTKEALERYQVLLQYVPDDADVHQRIAMLSIAKGTGEKATLHYASYRKNAGKSFDLKY